MTEQIKKMFENDFEDLGLTEVKELLLFWKFIEKIIPVIRNQTIDDCIKIAGRDWYNLEPSAGKPLQKKHIPLDPKMCTQLELFGYINCLGGLRASEMRELREKTDYSFTNNLLDEIIIELHKQLISGIRFDYKNVSDIMNRFREATK